MRKIIYAVRTNLNGYIARLDGSLDFLHLRPSNCSMMPFFKAIDVGLMGRKTYEIGLRMSGGKFESHEHPTARTGKSRILTGTWTAVSQALFA